MAARRVVDIVRLVAYALAVVLVVGVRGLAAVRGIAFADARYLHLAFGDTMRQVQVFAVAVGHSLKMYAAAAHSTGRLLAVGQLQKLTHQTPKHFPRSLSRFEVFLERPHPNVRAVLKYPSLVLVNRSQTNYAMNVISHRSPLRHAVGT